MRDKKVYYILINDLIHQKNMATVNRCTKEQVLKCDKTNIMLKVNYISKSLFSKKIN